MVFRSFHIVLNKKIEINLDFRILKLNICNHKVQTLIEMLSRKAEGIDPLKP